MLSIMNGYKNFKVKCEDTLSNPDFIEKANKIFVDLPVNTKIANLRFGMKTESSLIATEKTIDCLLQAQWQLCLQLLSSHFNLLIKSS